MRGAGRMTRRSWRVGGGLPGWAAALGMLIGGAGSLTAAEPQAGGLRVSVRQAGEVPETIRVGVERSIILDLSEPIARASIASDAVADVVVLSPVELMVTGKTFGTTQLILWTAEGTQKVIDIQVTLEIPALKEAIRRTAPAAQVEVMVLEDSVVLEGTAPDAAAAARIVRLAGVFSPNVINHLRVVGEQQVLLRCTVAEINRTALRQLGVNGFLAGEDFPDVFIVNNLAQINPANIGAAAAQLATGQLLFATDRDIGIPIQGNTDFSVGFPRAGIQFFLQALQEDRLAKILAEPNLVTLSGHEASFLAGGEFPFPIPQDQNTITIEFKEFGVRLRFTPTVLSDQVIRLKIAPEVSDLDFTSATQFAGFVIPSLTQRRAETTLEIGNGQTIAMAGLLSDELRGVISRLPGIGELPVIGQLFRRNEMERVQTELVILVTPEIVAPMNPDRVPAVPGEDWVPANDWQFYGLGRLLDEPAPDTYSREGALSTRWAPTGRPVRYDPSDPAFRGPWGYSATGEEG